MHLPKEMRTISRQKGFYYRYWQNAGEGHRLALFRKTVSVFLDVDNQTRARKQLVTADNEGGCCQNPGKNDGSQRKRE